MYRIVLLDDVVYFLLLPESLANLIEEKKELRNRIFN